MADQAAPKLMRDIVKDPMLLAEKRRELDVLRNDDAKEWTQNKEFYRGNQYVQWNSVSNSIQTLGTDDTTRPRYKVRLVNNLILPNVNQLVAQMTKTRPTIHATPNSGADRDVKAAQMAERLYEWWWEELGLRAKLQSALVHAQISQGYWLISWDGLAGKQMKVMLDPQTGRPIWDDELADIYREELRSVAEQQGLDPGALLQQFEQTVYVGDIRVQVLDGLSVWLDPVASNFEDCTYAICKFPMTVDEIAARYGKKVTPNASSGDRQPALLYTKKSYDDRPENVREVFIMYHKPSPALPSGKVVHWIEGPNEILDQGDWEHPFSALPLIKFPGIERPGSVYDEARTTHARSTQKEINDIISGVAMHRRLTMKPQMLAPVGSLRQRLTDEPGAVFEFNPVAGLAPQWRDTPSIPAYVFENLQERMRALDRLYNIMPTERSSLPARTDSGHLVDLVQEAVADQISPEIQRMEYALAQAGELMVAYAQKFYTEPRLLKIKGPGGSVQVAKFMNADLQGGFSFEAEAGSGLPRTRAGQVQQIKEMIEMGVLSPQEAVQYLPVAGLKGIQQRMASDEDFAHRQIEKLVKGIPLNVPALEQAIQQVQTTGINPATGTFFASPEEAQAFVEQAALSPQPFENHQVSMYVLSLHMKSVEFERYPPDVQQRFHTYYGALSQALAQSQVQPEDVRVTLGLNGTVGPTVAADILQRKGVQAATPETMAEPPLETSVYDSMDKPDTDEAGNDPLTQAEQMMSMQQAQAAHDLKQAKSVHQLAQAQASAEQSAQSAAQKQRHAEELHQERLRQARQPKPSGQAS